MQSQQVKAGSGQVAASKSEVGKKENEDVGWPINVEPYQPPPLQRYLLASRVKELEGRVDELGSKNADHPRIIVARTALEGARTMLRDAGGPTERRLAYSILDADERIGKAEAQLTQDEDELRRAKKRVEEAVEAQDKCEAKVRTSLQLVENAKARHAHLGFQVALEAGRHARGFEELVGALAEVEAHVLSSVSGRLGEAQSFVSRFVRGFQLVEYDKSTDPVLQEVASVGSQASTTTICVERWQDGEAWGECEAMEKEEGGKSRKVEGPKEAAKTEGCLRKVREAAASACVAIQLSGARRSTEKFNIGSGRAASSAPQRACEVPEETALVVAPRADEDMRGANKRSWSVVGVPSLQVCAMPPSIVGEQRQVAALALCKWTPLAVGQTSFQKTKRPGPHYTSPYGGGRGRSTDARARDVDT